MMTYIYFDAVRGEIHIQDTPREEATLLAKVDKPPTNGDKAFITSLMRRKGFEHTSGIKIIRHIP